MHIYAFGSICRGDISVESDIDLLALVNGHDERFAEDKYSLYSYKRIRELWELGNAFAWHLALESKLIFAENGQDFLKSLGPPSSYNNLAEDSTRFLSIFESAALSILRGTDNIVFEMSTIFLAIRNMATCYSLKCLRSPNFGRDSARNLGNLNIPISNNSYSSLMRARILSTRGIGLDIAESEAEAVRCELEIIRTWMNSLHSEAVKNG